MIYKVQVPDLICVKHPNRIAPHLGFCVKFKDSLFAKMLSLDILPKDNGASNEMRKSGKVESNFFSLSLIYSLLY